MHTIVALTDNAPQGLNQALSFSFAHATQVGPCSPLCSKWKLILYISKLGLIASSTPFVTGRPYTLLFNGSVKSSGAVGLALSGGPRPVSQTAFPGLRAITKPLKVTRCVTAVLPSHFLSEKQTYVRKSEGNLVNELDHANPITLLISAIEQSALGGHALAAKDDEFYLGVLRDGDGDGELWQLHHIMAGGPSRGTMALETETAPGEGTSVQVRPRKFCTHTTNTNAYISSSTDLLRVAISRRLALACPRTPSRSSPRPSSTTTTTTRRRLREAIMVVSRFSRTPLWLRARMGSW